VSAALTTVAPTPAAASATPGLQRGGGVLALFGPAALANFITAGLGVLWWVAAARSYQPAELGVAGATIALATGVGTAATGGMYQVLLRVLPGHAEAQRLLWRASAAAAAIAAVVGALAGAAGLGATTFPMPAVTLAVAAALWAVFALQDAVLLALRAPAALLASNVTNAVAKLALVVALAGSAHGIVWSWLLPLAVLVPAIGIVSHRIAGRRPATQRRPPTPLHQVGAEYASSLATLAVLSGVPVLVAATVAPAIAGLAITTWALFIAADAACAILAGSVVVTVSGGQRSLGDALRSLRAGALPLLGATVAAVAFAPVVLAVFGPAYAPATGMLRLLVVAMLVRLVAHLGFAALRLAGQFTRLVVAQVSFAATTLAGVTLATATNSSGTATATLTGIGVAAVVGAITAATLALLSAQRGHRDLAQP
jgi:O-antigen/teichoic acid export membrane protein